MGVEAMRVMILQSLFQTSSDKTSPTELALDRHPPSEPDFIETHFNLGRADPTSGLQKRWAQVVTRFLAVLGLAGCLGAGGPVCQSLRAAPASSTRFVASPKVVGGQQAIRGAYPWMTALVMRGQTPIQGQFCGGALIHPQWVLSAAHCVEGMSAASLDVLVGGYDLKVAGDGTRVAVSQIVIHPRFSTVQGALINDFALLKLSQPVTGVPVLPLVDALSQIAPGTRVRGIGWGTTSEGGRSSSILLEVDMNLVSVADASQVYPGLSDAHLAAGVPGGGRDTCQGDSGGPLVISDGQGGWLHAGTVSFGDGCGRDGIPGIYGNTLNQRSWILQNTGTTTTDDHGNTFATATPIVWNIPVRGVLETASDQDWFRLSVSGSGTLNLSSSGTNKMHGFLVKAPGTVLAQDARGAGAPNFLIVTNVTSGSYYLKVTGSGSSKGAYTVLAKWTAAPGVAGSPEIGLVGFGAAPIADGTRTAKIADGTDFGMVEVTADSRSTTFSVRNTGKATLTLSPVRLSGSGAAQFRVTTQVPATVAAGRSAAFQITFDPTVSGRHDASVTLPNNDANEAPYDFVVSGTGKAAADDVGNTPATATRVAVPSTTQAELGVPKDQDVFQFVLTQTATVSLASTGALDTHGRLLDASGQIVAENDDLGVGSNFRIRRRLLAGTYYIVVRGASDTETGAYSLQISQ